MFAFKNLCYIARARTLDAPLICHTTFGHNTKFSSFTRAMHISTYRFVSPQTLARAYSTSPPENTTQHSTSEALTSQENTINFVDLHNRIFNLLKQARADEALKIIEEAQKEHQHLFTVDTWNGKMRALCELQLGDRAITTFHEMMALGIQPNNTTYTTVIRAHAIVGDHESAEKFLGKLKEAGYTPNRLAYSSLLRAYTSAGIVDKAEKLFEEMKSSVVIDRNDTLNMIRLYITANESAKGHAFANLASKRGWVVPPRLQFDVFENCILCDYIPGARELFEGYVRDGVKLPHGTLYLLLVAAARQKQWSFAETVLNTIRQSGYPVTALEIGAMLHVYTSTKILKKSLQAFNQLCGLLNPMHPEYANMLSRAFADTGMVEASVNYLEELQKSGETIHLGTFNVIVAKAAAAGDVEKAQQLIEQAPKLFGLSPDINSFNAFLRGCTNGQKLLNSAMKMINHMAKNKISPNAESFLCMIKCAFKEENIKVVNHTLSLLQKENIKSFEVYELLIYEWVARGDYGKAIDSMEEMQKAGFRVPDRIQKVVKGEEQPPPSVNPAVSAPREQQPLPIPPRTAGARSEFRQ